MLILFLFQHVCILFNKPPSRSRNFTPHQPSFCAKNRDHLFAEELGTVHGTMIHWLTLSISHLLISSVYPPACLALVILAARATNFIICFIQSIGYWPDILGASIK